MTGSTAGAQDILLGPGLGEDSAVIDFGEEVCVISTDPITGASQRLGWLAVHVACNVKQRTVPSR